MLNRVIEKNTVKCFQYFPEQDKRANLAFRTFLVSLKSETKTPHFIVREFELRKRKNVAPKKKAKDSDESSDESAEASTDEDYAGTNSNSAHQVPPTVLAFEMACFVGVPLSVIVI